ncbi:MAG: sensor histidine kinase [Candidatus Omnitrophica bacterium]|nr:sensor histidine kinase [Candidatus Omnitrophota bacterium]
MTKQGTFKPRPHARIITMIGEQLIRNEKVALMELIKNSYDADASWVQVRFINFKDKDGELIIQKDSVIEIEDDGIGMSFDIIQKSWVNPASPYKFLMRKEGKEETKKGRIIQGEKGIGRFAVYKLGSTVEIFTRPEKDNVDEIYLKSDLSIYDEELIGKKAQKSEEPLYLDDIEYSYEIRAPKVIEKKEIVFKNSRVERLDQGTLIRITNLKGHWTGEKIREIFNDCLKLISPFNEAEFNCDIVVNGTTYFTEKEQEHLRDLLELAPIKIEGSIDVKGNVNYKLSKKKEELMTLKELSTDSEIREKFFDKEGHLMREPECGPFNFKFYVFDLDRKASLESPLSKEDRKIIKSHRVYLYRDGIRVYPYGDPTDDWLEIDIKRGTVRAGSYLSNDQVIGYIEITNKHSPALRDKTNREGLMDIGYSYEDFKALNLGILGLLRTEFRKYKDDQHDKRKKIEEEEGILATEQVVKENIDVLKKYFEDKKDTKGSKLINFLAENYDKEKSVLNERVEIVEDLAGVGMTVDAASHDLTIMMERAKETLNLLFEMMQGKEVDIPKLKETTEKVRGQFAFIEDQLHGIQPLFRSSRRHSKNWRIKEIIEKVKLYYTVPIKDRKINVIVEEKGPPLVVKCTEGILLQAFINLIDNAVYWLTTADRKDKTIKIVFNGNKSEVLFADNGPGIKKDDQPYIFKPFFTTKGVKGRGLGLYITRQLLDRYDFSIELIVKEKNKILSGANFLVNFGDVEAED